MPIVSRAPLASRLPGPVWVWIESVRGFLLSPEKRNTKHFSFLFNFMDSIDWGDIGQHEIEVSRVDYPLRDLLLQLRKWGSGRALTPPPHSDDLQGSGGWEVGGIEQRAASFQNEPGPGCCGKF